MSATKKTSNKQDKIVLEAEKRETLGKKVKHLRSEGKIPANVYGPKIDSTAIQVETRDFFNTYRKAGETQVVYINLGKQEIPVIIQNFQMHPVTDDALHVDFKKVDLTKKIETQVPISIIGESPAVEQKKADLLTLMDTLLIEALPTSVPQEIEIDISSLKEFEDEIKISDLTSGKDYSFKDEDDRVVVKVAEHKEEVIEVEPAAPIEGEEGAEEATEGEAEDKDGAEEATEDGEEKSEDKSGGDDKKE